MWVKIKSENVPDMVLEVPYSAFLNSYKHKGYKIINNNAKNSTDNNIEQETKEEVNIKLDSEDIKELEQIKEQVQEDEPKKVVEKDTAENEQVDMEDAIDKKIKEIKEEKVEKQTNYAPTRSPVKKSPSIKR